MSAFLVSDNVNGAALAARAYARVYTRLPACRRAILDVLITTNREMTANEIANYLRTNASLDNNSTRTRLNELVKMKLIRKSGTKIDPVSNMQVTAYKALKPHETVPVPLTHGPSKKAIQAELDALMDAIAAYLEAYPDQVEKLCEFVPQ